MGRNRHPRSAPSRLRQVLGGLFVWAVIPAVAALLLVAVLPEVSATARVALGRGDAGTFTAEKQICARSARSGVRCEWRGSFVDATGGDLRRTVFLEGDPRGWQPGTTGQVIWLPDRPTSVFLVRNPRPLILVAGLTLVAATALLAWSMAAFCRVTGRRTPRWIERIHRFCGWPPITS